MKEYLERHKIILGGPGMVFEIDESMLNHKVKVYMSRTPAKQPWVFRMVDLYYTPARGVMKVVNARNASTLIPLIQEHVIPGSVKHSRKWSAYNNLSNLGYGHNRVCHKYEFICRETGVHSQHIESFWNKQKNRVKKMLGVKGSMLSC